MIVDYKKYEEFCEEACLKYGLSQEASKVTANLLVRTDMLGIYTHGTLNLEQYLIKTTKGGTVVTAVPEIVADGPSWAIIDGHNGMGVYNGYYGLNVGIEKAKNFGVSYVGIRGSGHFGATGIYAITAAEQGMIALIMSNVDKNMNIPGAAGAVIGNSPISYAVPAGKHRPIFMDIATSNVSGLKITRLLSEGKPIPENWIVDSEGRPTTDPTLPGWALLPMSGHKGYCLSLFIEIMSSVLTGGCMLHVAPWRDLPAKAQTSHSFILIDIEAMMKMELFYERMESIIKEISEFPKADGSDRIYLPGEIEWANYETALKIGLALPQDIEKNARSLAVRTGLDFEKCNKQ